MKSLSLPNRYWIAFVVIFIYLFAVLFANGMTQRLDRDEYQFIASGALLADKMLLPYRDYPYFHMPNLIIVYAALFKVFHYYLLVARASSVVSAWCALTLIFTAVVKACSGYRLFTRFLVGLCVVTLLLMNPVFQYSSGLAWNHDLSILLCLVSCLLFLNGLGINKKGSLLLSGLFLGLSIGARLSFILAVIPFLGAILLWPAVLSSAKSYKKVRSTLLFLSGLLLALLPSLFMIVLAPRQFVFGNIEYAGLNTQWREMIGYSRSMTFMGKIEYFIEEVLRLPGNLLLGILFLFAMISIFGSPDWRKKKGFKILFIFTLALFLLLGAFLVTPSWFQYFYAPIPFLVLAIGCWIGEAWNREFAGRVKISLLMICALLSTYYGLDYLNIDDLWNPSAWTTMQSHQMGIVIKEQAGEDARILTLTPLFALEGGLSIYPELATGPFAWRTGSLISEDKRMVMKVISRENLASHLDRVPPDAILVDYEPNWIEQPMIDWALANGYRSIELGDKDFLLMVPPN